MYLRTQHFVLTHIYSLRLSNYKYYLLQVTGAVLRFACVCVCQAAPHAVRLLAAEVRLYCSGQVQHSHNLPTQLLISCQ